MQKPKIILLIISLLLFIKIIPANTQENQIILIILDCSKSMYGNFGNTTKFESAKEIIKELANLGWLIVRKKPKFTGISLNTSFKKETRSFGVCNEDRATVITLISGQIPFWRNASTVPRTRFSSSS